MFARQLSHSNSCDNPVPAEILMTFFLQQKPMKEYIVSCYTYDSRRIAISC